MMVSDIASPANGAQTKALRLSPWTPTHHPFTPTAHLAKSLENFGRDGKLRAHHNDNSLAAGQPYFYRFPVEHTFFRAFSPLPCTDLAQSMPPEGIKCDHEPKFSCGPISALEQHNDCQIFSIGSRLQICFEQYVHFQAPGCTIHTFDPSVSPAQAAKFSRFFRYHKLGLSAVPSETINTSWRGKITVHPGRLRPMMVLLKEANVSWVHYLKVDCEGCETSAIPQFLIEANATFGHIPVTQLHLEVHASGPDDLRSNTHADAVKLLAMLRAYGFMPFHVDFDRFRGNKSYNTEIAFLNMQAPPERMPPLKMAGAESGVTLRQGRRCYGHPKVCPNV